MRIFKKKKNISYWVEYCKKNSITKLYLVLKGTPYQVSVDERNTYRLRYNCEINGYVLEVFSKDRFLIVNYTSLWDEWEYKSIASVDIEKKIKFVLINNEWMPNNNNNNVEPIKTNKKDKSNNNSDSTINQNVVYHDFTNKNLQ